MPIKRYKPTSPGRRFATYADRSELTKTEPEKSLVEGLTQVRRAQHPRAHHVAPPRRRRQAQVPRHRLQADQGRRAGARSRDRVRPEPHRAHRAAALRRRREALHPRAEPAARGHDRDVGRHGRHHRRQRLPLRRIPTGTIVHNVELTPGRGGQLGRSAGVEIQLVAKEGERATLRLPSGEMRQVPVDCRASIGAIGNSDHQNIDIGKARAQPPQGQAPADARHGDEPRRPSARRRRGLDTAGPAPVTPWGVPTLGYPTRKKRKPSDRWIVRAGAGAARARAKQR